MTQHITICQRIVRTHRHMRHISVAATRTEVLRLAVDPGEPQTHDDQLLREKLEHATDMSIADLAKLAERWPT